MMESLLNLNKRLRSLVPVEKRSKNLTFVFVLLATTLDNFSVAGSMTTYYSVVQHFNTDSSTASWSLSAYALTLGAFIMLTGKITDVLGPEIVFITGLFLNGIFALICAVIDHTIIAMIVFRAIQGIFAASLIPSSFAIAGSFYQGKQLGNAITCLILTITAIYGVALVVGGAFSLTCIGYKGIHYVTFAASMLLAIILYFTAYPVPRTIDHEGLSLRNLDYLGSFLFVTSLTLIILGLTEGGNSWKQPTSYVPLVIGVLLLIGSLIFEMVYIQNFKDKVNADLKDIKEDVNPNNKSDYENIRSLDRLTLDWRYKLEMLFPREVIHIDNFVTYAVATLICYIAYIAVLVTMVQYFQYVQQDSQIICGLKVLPISWGFTTGAAVNREGWIYKVGMKRVIVASQIGCVCMLVWLSRHNFQTSNNYWKYECFSLLLYAYSLNIYFSTYLNAVMRRAPVHLHGVVSGLLQTVGQVGICLGNSIFSSIVGEVKLSPDIAYRLHLHHKFQTVLYLGIGLCALMFFVLLFFIKDQKSVDLAPVVPDGPAEGKEPTEDI